MPRGTDLYAQINLGDCRQAGKSYIGHSQSLLDKLYATKIPKYVLEDLSLLVETEAQLVEIQCKIS